MFIAFQIWVLGMSFMALLTESIPYISATLATHAVATGWSAYQISNTANFQKTFTRVVTDGSCSGVNLLPNYWVSREREEYPILALNIAALLLSAFLAWRLIMVSHKPDWCVHLLTVAVLDSCSVGRRLNALEHLVPSTASTN